MKQRKTAVVVLFGGPGSEHDVSCRSAVNLIRHLDRERYDVTPVRITRTGGWIAGKDPEDYATLDVARLLNLTGGTGDKTLRTAADSLADTVSVLAAADVVFPALHAAAGESGPVQALLDLLQVRYVGNTLLSGAINADREYTRALLAAEGVTVPAAGAASGRAINVAVLEGMDGCVVTGPPLEAGRPGASGPGEPGTDTGQEADLPPSAALGPVTGNLLHEQALAVFRALRCRGLLQVDFVLQGTEAGVQLAVNEVHMMPALSAASHFPRIWASTGLELPALLTLLVERALTDDRRPGARATAA